MTDLPSFVTPLDRPAVPSPDLSTGYWYLNFLAQYDRLYDEHGVPVPPHFDPAMHSHITKAVRHAY